MSRPAKIWLFAGLSVLLYAVLVWFLATWLGLQGGDAWVLRGGLWLLGVVAAGAVVWYLLKKHRAAAGAAAPLDAANEIDALVGAAQQRLAQSRVAGGARFGALPAVLVVGPAGSTKSTAIVRSGLEPELLAGEVFRGEQIAPTPLLNLWYARGAVWAEAAGAVTGDPARRARFFERLRATSLGAALGRGAQAPRVAVVCFPCDEFVKPGSTDAVPAAARQLRAVLAEAAQTMGVKLPVYVVFTKADRVPGFAEYVQNLTRDEVREPLGATLPAAADDGSVYADRETARWTDAFRRLYERLAQWRLAVLPREHAAERKPGAYEFPREVRKLAPLAVQFLVELGRPSQLTVSPFVRGFYFVGVRAVLVSESAGGAPAVAQPAAPQTSGATSVFGAYRAPGAPAAAPAAAVTTKKPQWVFLDRLFPEVVLADRSALAATAGGTRVSGLRRAMLAAAALLALFVGGAFTVSWASNRGLADRAMTAAQAALPATAPAREPLALPAVDELRRLDSLRAVVTQLDTFARDGAPLHLRWGLYVGNRLEPDARRLYWAAFERTMFGDTRAAMLRQLRALPATQSAAAEYGATYDLLKAYLISARHADKSTVPFLAPVLQRIWLDGREVDGARDTLARRQFAYYAEELQRRGDPYRSTADEPAVEKGRAYLAQFAGADAIYQFMTSEAARQNPAVHFNRGVPGSAAFVVNGYEVPGAYTKGGYAFMQDALANVDRYLSGEEWVLGPNTSLAALDRRQVAAQLRTRYDGDFLRHWRQFVRTGTVVRASNLKDAARRLQVLSGPQSPLLAMLALASRHTGVDTAGPIVAAFQPVHAVTPPAVTDRNISEANQPWVQALAGLFSAVDQAANAPPGQGEAFAQQAASAASQAKLTVNQMASGFAIDTVARLDAAVAKLLTDPITSVEPFLRNVGSGEVNAAGARFCSVFSPLLNKYPFNPNATVNATPAEVADMFKPGQGLLWKFHDEALQRLIVRQGAQYVRNPTSPVAPNPAFLRFFSRAAQFADAMYRDGAQEPRLTFALRPTSLSDAIPSVTFAVDQQVARFTAAANDPNPFVWTPTATSTARLAGQFGGSDVTFLGPYQGPWALFRLFHQAERWTPNGSSHTVEWTIRTQGQAMTLADGTPVHVIVDLNLGSVPPIFQRGWFDSMRCVGTVAQ